MYERAQDFGTENSLAFHIGNLRDDFYISEDEQCGLESFLRELIEENGGKS